MNATIVKVGGSLTAQPKKLRALCLKLSELSKSHRLIVVPGGGEFADVVRQLDKRFSLPCSVSHRMAILGMDQYGYLLSDLTPNSCLTDTLEEIPALSGSGKLPIFLPSNLLLSENPLEKSWDVTSDSIAVYIASKLQVPTVLLIKDVDGVFTKDPKMHPNAELIKKISAQQLSAKRMHTSVDVFLPKLLLKLPLSCYVINGLFPQRVETVLEGKEEICTLIEGAP